MYVYHGRDASHLRARRESRHGKGETLFPHFLDHTPLSFPPPDSRATVPSSSSSSLPYLPPPFPQLRPQAHCTLQKVWREIRGHEQRVVHKILTWCGKHSTTYLESRFQMGNPDRHGERQLGEKMNKSGTFTCCFGPRGEWSGERDLMQYF